MAYLRPKSDSYQAINMETVRGRRKSKKRGVKGGDPVSQTIRESLKKDYKDENVTRRCFPCSARKKSTPKSSTSRDSRSKGYYGKTHAVPHRSSTSTMDIQNRNLFSTCCASKRRPKEYSPKIFPKKAPIGSNRIPEDGSSSKSWVCGGRKKDKMEVESRRSESYFEEEVPPRGTKKSYGGQKEVTEKKSCHERRPCGGTRTVTQKPVEVKRSQKEGQKEVVEKKSCLREPDRTSMESKRISIKEEPEMTSKTSKMTSRTSKMEPKKEVIQKKESRISEPKFGLEYQKEDPRKANLEKEVPRGSRAHKTAIFQKDPGVSGSRSSEGPRPKMTSKTSKTSTRSKVTPKTSEPSSSRVPEKEVRKTSEFPKEPSRRRLPEKEVKEVIRVPRGSDHPKVTQRTSTTSKNSHRPSKVAPEILEARRASKRASVKMDQPRPSYQERIVGERTQFCKSQEGPSRCGASERSRQKSLQSPTSAAISERPQRPKTAVEPRRSIMREGSRTSKKESVRRPSVPRVYQPPEVSRRQSRHSQKSYEPSPTTYRRPKMSERQSKTSEGIREPRKSVQQPPKRTSDRFSIKDPTTIPKKQSIRERSHEDQIRKRSLIIEYTDGAQTGAKNAPRESVTIAYVDTRKNSEKRKKSDAYYRDWKVDEPVTKTEPDSGSACQKKTPLQKGIEKSQRRRSTKRRSTIREYSDDHICGHRKKTPESDKSTRTACTTFSKDSKRARCAPPGFVCGTKDPIRGSLTKEGMKKCRCKPKKKDTQSTTSKEDKVKKNWKRDTKGNLRDTQGNLRDEHGNLRDENGNWLDPQGNWRDKYGKILDRDAKGNYKDPNGKWRDANGNLLPVQEGKSLTSDDREKDKFLEKNKVNIDPDALKYKESCPSEGMPIAAGDVNKCIEEIKKMTCAKSYIGPCRSNIPKVCGNQESLGKVLDPSLVRTCDQLEKCKASGQSRPCPFPKKPEGSPCSGAPLRCRDICGANSRPGTCYTKDPYEGCRRICGAPRPPCPTIRPPCPILNPPTCPYLPQRPYTASLSPYRNYGYLSKPLTDWDNFEFGFDPFLSSPVAELIDPGATICQPRPRTCAATSSRRNFGNSLCQYSPGCAKKLGFQPSNLGSNLCRFPPLCEKLTDPTPQGTSLALKRPSVSARSSAKISPRLSIVSPSDSKISKKESSESRKFLVFDKPLCSACNPATCHCGTCEKHRLGSSKNQRPRQSNISQDSQKSARKSSESTKSVQIGLKSSILSEGRNSIKNSPRGSRGSKRPTLSDLKRKYSATKSPSIRSNRQFSTDTTHNLKSVTYEPKQIPVMRCLPTSKKQCNCASKVDQRPSTEPRPKSNIFTKSGCPECGGTKYFENITHESYQKAPNLVNVALEPMFGYDLDNFGENSNIKESSGIQASPTSLSVSAQTTPSEVNTKIFRSKSTLTDSYSTNTSRQKPKMPQTFVQLPKRTIQHGKTSIFDSEKAKKDLFDTDSFDTAKGRLFGTNSLKQRAKYLAELIQSETTNSAKTNSIEENSTNETVPATPTFSSILDNYSYKFSLEEGPQNSYEQGPDYIYSPPSYITPPQRGPDYSDSIFDQNLSYRRNYYENSGRFSNRCPPPGLPHYLDVPMIINPQMSNLEQNLFENRNRISGGSQPLDFSDFSDFQNFNNFDWGPYYTNFYTWFYGQDGFAYEDFDSNGYGDHFEAPRPPSRRGPRPKTPYKYVPIEISRGPFEKSRKKRPKSAVCRTQKNYENDAKQEILFLPIQTEISKNDDPNWFEIVQNSKKLIVNRPITAPISTRTQMTSKKAPKVHREKSRTIRVLKESLKQNLPHDNQGTEVSSDLVAIMMHHEELGYQVGAPPRSKRSLIQDIVNGTQFPYALSSSNVNTETCFSNDIEDGVKSVEMSKIDTRTVKFADEFSTNESKSSQKGIAKKEALKFSDRPDFGHNIDPKYDLEAEIPSYGPQKNAEETVPEAPQGPQEPFQEAQSNLESNENEISDVEYIVESEPPKHYSLVQVRGSTLPFWFPGYFSAFPNSKVDNMKIEKKKSPSGILKRAWEIFNPAEILKNSEIVIV